MVDTVPDVVTVPLHAVVEHDARTYVVVKDDGNRLHPRQVELGKANETRVSIESGLAEGDSIAINAQDLMDMVFTDEGAPIPAS